MSLNATMKHKNIYEISKEVQKIIKMHFITSCVQYAIMSQFQNILNGQSYTTIKTLKVRVNYKKMLMRFF